MEFSYKNTLETQENKDSVDFRVKGHRKEPNGRAQAESRDV